MVVQRKKKVGKYRGYSTHGGGARKKRRGAGSRGGRGRAGSGKRAGHKKYGIVLGRVGFTSKSRTHVCAINVSYFTSERLEKFVAAGKATKDKTGYVIDLGALGYTKLLGTGSITSKVRFTVAHATTEAVEKVKAAGGEVVQ